MRTLALVIFFSFLSIATTAQELKLNLEKTGGKYGLNLKQARPLASPNHFRIGIPTVVIEVQNQFKSHESVMKNGIVYPLVFGNMPCLTPSTDDIAKMPNPSPGLELPEVALIPNPLFKSR
jgi:hypothetical protein